MCFFLSLEDYELPYYLMFSEVGLRALPPDRKKVAGRCAVNVQS